MHEFKELVRQLSNEKLMSLRANITNGIATEMINMALAEDTALVCPVCERNVDEQLDLVLHFGPQGFRQKARFCGHDCLEYFLQRRKRNAQSLNNLQEDEN